MENNAESILSLQKEAEQTAEDQKENVVNIDFKMVAFSLAGKDYAIDILKVKEIAKAGRFTYVPNTSPFVLGVYNLRGDIIPIIDLRLFFNIDIPERTGNEIENMIIVNIEEQTFGIVVDEIDKVVGIQKSTIQPPHPLFGDISIKYIAGVVESNNHLYIILDIDKIFGSKNQSKISESANIEEASVEENVAQENAVEENVAAKPKLAEAATTKMVENVVAKPQPKEEPKSIDFTFIKDGLQNFKKFAASDINMPWVESRYSEWEQERPSDKIQLSSTEDAEEYLKTFYSNHTGEFWSESFAQSLYSLLPDNEARQINVWNPGCGKGYESFSLACVLKKRYPEARIKIYAHDVDLLSVSNATLLTLPPDIANSWYNPFVTTTITGDYTFSQIIKDMILFEYHDCLNTTAMPAADIIFARDILSFLQEQSQNELLSIFEEKIKGNGVLFIGDNEKIPARNNKWEAKLGNKITMYLKH